MEKENILVIPRNRIGIIVGIAETLMSEKEIGKWDAQISKKSTYFIDVLFLIIEVKRFHDPILDRLKFKVHINLQIFKRMQNFSNLRCSQTCRQSTGRFYIRIQVQSFILHSSLCLSVLISLNLNFIAK